MRVSTRPCMRPVPRHTQLERKQERKRYEKLDARGLVATCDTRDLAGINCERKM